MNALENMACVKNGNETLKSRGLFEMGSWLTRKRMLLTDPEAIEKAKIESAALLEKAEKLPDEFFKGIDCKWNHEGPAIARAVTQAK